MDQGCWEYSFLCPQSHAFVIRSVALQTLTLAPVIRLECTLRSIGKGCSNRQGSEAMNTSIEIYGRLLKTERQDSPLPRKADAERIRESENRDSVFLSFVLSGDVISPAILCARFLRRRLMRPACLAQRHAAAGSCRSWCMDKVCRHRHTAVLFEA